MPLKTKGHFLKAHYWLWVRVTGYRNPRNAGEAQPGLLFFFTYLMASGLTAGDFMCAVSQCTKARQFCKEQQRCQGGPLADAPYTNAVELNLEGLLE